MAVFNLSSEEIVNMLSNFRLLKHIKEVHQYQNFKQYLIKKKSALFNKSIKYSRPLPYLIFKTITQIVLDLQIFCYLKYKFILYLKVWFDLYLSHKPAFEIFVNENLIKLQELNEI